MVDLRIAPWLIIGLVVIGLAIYFATQGDDPSDDDDNNTDTVNLPQPQPLPKGCEATANTEGFISAGQILNRPDDVARLSPTVDRFEWKADFAAPLEKNTTYYWGKGENHIGFSYDATSNKLDVVFMDATPVSTAPLFPAPSSVKLSTKWEEPYVKVYLTLNDMNYTGYTNEPFIQVGPMSKDDYQLAVRESTLAMHNGDEAKCVQMKTLESPTTFGLPKLVSQYIKEENTRCSGTPAYSNIGYKSCTAAGSTNNDCRYQLTKYPAYCKQICDQDPECVGFEFVRKGNYSGGLGNMDIGEGNCMFRKEINSNQVSTNFLRDCYIKN